MNSEILKKQFSTSSFFTILFGFSGWVVAMVIVFFSIAWLFTPPQFCGYYLDHGHAYKIKAYWKFGADTTVYETYNGKEAIEVLKQLNEQPIPLKKQPREQSL